MHNANRNDVASVIFAAGKGSRMVGYNGNKTLLPLVPKPSRYEGEHPLLSEVLESLPAGPRGIVVHHCAEEVRNATRGDGLAYLFQPTMNGTGGALLAARPFLESVSQEHVIITMGDVPLIHPQTYERLVAELQTHLLAVLAFAPRDKARYGLLDLEDDRVVRIVEWEYWHRFPQDIQDGLRFCNAGVYAVRRSALLRYLERLQEKPHRVSKQRGEEWITIEEYFLTDLVELMAQDKVSIGMVLASEEEVVGVDTPQALERVQAEYASRPKR